MPNIGLVEMVFIGAAIVFVVLIIVGVTRNAARSDKAEAWADKHELVLTETTLPLVSAYLTRSRRFRLGGALIGIIVPFGSNTPGFEMMMGYLLGALIAEFTQPRLFEGDTRSAALLPRSLTDYVPGYVPIVLRAAAVLGVAYVSLYVWGPQRDINWEMTVWAGGAAAVLLPVLVELLLHRMVARPQPAGSPELLEVNDAIRATSVHAAAGAGTGASLLMLAGMTMVVGFTTDIQLLRWVLPALAFAVAIGALVIWMALGPASPWKVQRRVPEASA